MRRRAFTLIELLVVMAIIVLLVGISVISLKAISKGSGTASASNLVRALLSATRATAISQHRQAALVFYEQSRTNASPMSAGQTAVILAVEDRVQLYYSGGSWVSPASGNTIFVVAPNTSPQFAPGGIQISTLGDLTVKDSGNPSLSTTQMHTGLTGVSPHDKCRAIVFDADGQMILREGLCVRDTSVDAEPIGKTPPSTTQTPTAGQNAKLVGDWNFSLPQDTNPPPPLPPVLAQSSPGILIYNREDFASQTFTSDYEVSQWLQKNAETMIVNSYTGQLIR